MKTKLTTHKELLSKLTNITSCCIITTVCRDCVLACPFCYARDPENMPPKQVLADEWLEKIIKDGFNTRHKKITFEWSGGEALMAGKKFFEKILLYQDKHKRCDKTYSNCIQTSGGLYNEELYDFLIENKFSLGMTIDGPKDLHNIQRPTKGGSSSYETVMKSYEYIRQKQGYCGVLGTITKKSLGREKELLNFYKDLGVKSIYSNTYFHDPNRPIRKESMGLTPDEYANFYIKEFDSYLEMDDLNFTPRHTCGFMDVMAGITNTTKCSYGGLCLSNFINIDAEGYVTHCPKFMGYTDFRFGHIKDASLDDYLNPNKNKILYRMIKERKKCINSCEKDKCPYLKTCNSGCPYYSTLNGNPCSIAEREIICDGKKKLFNHITLKMNEYGINSV